MSELDDLIAEQAAEMKRGPRQSRQEFVVMSLDVQDSSWEPRPVDARGYKGCMLHGRTYMKAAKRGSSYCAECHKKRARDSIRRKRAAVRFPSIKGGDGQVAEATNGE